MNKNCAEQIAKLKEEIQNADAIVIGAGAGHDGTDDANPGGTDSKVSG